MRRRAEAEATGSRNRASEAAADAAFECNIGRGEMSWVVDREMSSPRGGMVAGPESGIPAMAEDEGPATQQGGAAGGRGRQGRQDGPASPLPSPLTPSMRAAGSALTGGGRPASAMSGNMFARPLSRHQARAFSRMSQRSIEVSLDVFRAEIELNRSLQANQPPALVAQQVLPRADPVFKTKRLG